MKQYCKSIIIKTQGLNYVSSEFDMSAQGIALN